MFIGRHPKALLKHFIWRVWIILQLQLPSSLLISVQ
jgi:hypothetical protein